MTDSNLPADKPADDSPPEVKLELTRAGVREVLSLYAEETAMRNGYAGAHWKLEDFLHAGQRYWKRIALLGLLGLILGAVVANVATPIWTVTAEVVIERQDPTEERMGNDLAGSAFVATQAEILQSRSVVSRALEKLGPPPSASSQANPVSAVQENLQASPISGTQVVALSYIGPDLQYGTDLLVAAVTAYRDQLKNDELENQAQRLAAKEAEYRLLTEELNALEERLAGLRAENFSGGSAEEAIAAYNRIIADQTQRLGSVRQQRLALENQLIAGNLSNLRDDPVTRALMERLVQAEAELGRVQQTLRPGHPTVEAAQREVNLLRRQLQSTEDASPNALRKEIEAARGVETELENLLRTERNNLTNAERARRQEQLVQDELAQMRDLLDIRRVALLDQRLLARLAEAGEIGVTASLIASPIQPAEPTWPRLPLLLALGLAAGLGIGWVWALVSYDRSGIRNVDHEKTG